LPSSSSFPLRSTPATSATSAWKRCRPLWFRVNTALRIAWIGCSLLLAPLRRRYSFDPNKLQALILVRDLHSCLQPLVEAFQRQGIPLSRIILVDTGSTAPACLTELGRMESLGCVWLRVPPTEQAFGPYAPWLSPALRRQLRGNPHPYLVTDADLSFPPGVPDDWLQRLLGALNAHRFVLKASLPLRTDDITVADSERIVAHERGLMLHPAYRLLTSFLLSSDPGHFACTTDTTLSLYRPARHFSTLSVRLPVRYALCHLPWYQEFLESEEFRYYTDHKLPLFGEWSSLQTHA
jgi:hypothetical protein